MKKLFAAVLCIIAVFTFSFGAFAEKSPEAEQVVQVTIFNANPISGISQEGKAEIIQTGDIVVCKAVDDKGSFDGWTIYKVEVPEGSTEQKISVAVEGKDYVFVDGGFKALTIKVNPFVSLIICANYNGLVTDPATGELKKPESPKTGNNAIMLASVMMLASAAFVFAKTNKLLSK